MKGGAGGSREAAGLLETAQNTQLPLPYINRLLKEAKKQKQRGNA